MSRKTFFCAFLCLSLWICFVWSGSWNTVMASESQTSGEQVSPISDTDDQAALGVDGPLAASVDDLAASDADGPLAASADDLAASGTDGSVRLDVMTARPSVNGRLHVEGTQLVDESGTPVQLRGLSTHGLTWFPEIINEPLFAHLSKEWDCSLIRLAMYSDVYCNGEKEESLELVRKGIDAAIKADMYVIVDWHILIDSDPRIYQSEAAEFFDLIASEYAQYPNLIFEICNEPNDSTNWSDIMEYSRQIIPVIRARVPEAVILVGTPEYDQNLSSAILRPLEFDNIMYVLHFYAATHKEGLMEELRMAVDAGLPVFVSECGLSESFGGGIVDYESAAAWFTLLNEYKISYSVWSLCDKAESSALLVPGFDVTPWISDDNLTDTGMWVRQLIQGWKPSSIEKPVSYNVYRNGSFVRSLITNTLGGRYYDAVELWLFFAGGAVLILLLFGVIRFL